MADLILTIIIPEENIVDTKVGFFAKLPNNKTGEKGGSLYTDEEWMEKCAQDFIERTYRQGKRILTEQMARKANVINTDIFNKRKEQ